MYPEIHALQIRSSQVLVSVSSRVQLIFDLNTSSAISNLLKYLTVKFIENYKWLDQ